MTEGKKQWKGGVEEEAGRQVAWAGQKRDPTPAGKLS